VCGCVCVGVCVCVCVCVCACVFMCVRAHGGVLFGVKVYMRLCLSLRGWTSPIKPGLFRVTNADKSLTSQQLAHTHIHTYTHITHTLQVSAVALCRLSNLHHSNWHTHIYTHMHTHIHTHYTHSM
jgi:hypothetical protein